MFVTSTIPRLAKYSAIANVAAQGGIVVTGAVVRLTGSGLGCPTWPQCVNGSYVPVLHQAQTWHKYVEFTNRLLTFVLVIIAVAVAGLFIALAVQRSRRGLPRRTAVLWLAFAPLLGIVAQAVAGGITVLTHLNPVMVSVHFLLSVTLVALAVALVVRSDDPGDQPVTLLVDHRLRAYVWLVWAATLAVVLMGVITTGSGPHSGDAQAEVRYPFDPRIVAWFHADLVWAFLGLTVGLIALAYAMNAPSELRHRAVLLLLVGLVQGAIGYLQYFTGLPTATVTMHVTGAICLWIVACFLPGATRRRG
jgi:heme a synthase